MVLYLHIGLPKTGTTSLQQFLAANPAALAKHGYIYPDRWRTADLAHHRLRDIVEVESPDEPAPPILDEFLAYLREPEAPNTIVSSEALTTGLTPRGLPRLRDLLERACQITGVKVIVVLRRMDAQVESMFLNQVKFGKRSNKTLNGYLDARLKVYTRKLFVGLKNITAPDHPWSAQVVPYIEKRDSVGPVLEAMDLPAVLEGAERPRNYKSKLGLKAQSVLALPDAKLKELGIGRNRLVMLFESKMIELPDEVYDYDVLGTELRTAFHENALKQAQKAGITEYVEAFASDRLPESEQVVPRPALLSGSDVKYLRESLRLIRNHDRSLRRHDRRAVRLRARSAQPKR